MGNSLKLRGSYGTAFNAPSFLDLYGVGSGYVGNPTLQPERSQGWDMGADFYAPGDQGTLSFSWFQTDFENLIVDNFNVDPATTENVGKARETAARRESRVPDGAGLHPPYEAFPTPAWRRRTSRTRLLQRRPHYEAGVDLWSELGRGFSLGMSAGWVGTRADVDAQTFDTVYDPSYDVVRVYAALKISHHLTLNVRVENALNRTYEPVNGYPALGRGNFRWRLLGLLGPESIRRPCTPSGTSRQGQPFFRRASSPPRRFQRRRTPPG